MYTPKTALLTAFLFAFFALLLWGTLRPAHSQETPAADLTLHKAVAPLTALAPGDALQYTLTFSNSGILTATEVLISDTLPTLLTDLTVTSTLPLTPTGHAWAVGSLPPGAGGWVFTLTVSFTDPGLDDTHLAEITWGDGMTDTVNPAPSPFTAPHLYAIPGTYPATVRVWDNDGGQGAASIAVMVLPVEDTVHFQYLPLVENFLGNPMNFVEVFPLPNRAMVARQSMLTAAYGIELWAETVSAQTVILHSLQAGNVTGTLSVVGNQLILVPARSFQPGETLHATLTTEIGAGMQAPSVSRTRIRWCLPLQRPSNRMKPCGYR